MKRLMLAVFLAFLAVTAWATTMICNIDKMTLFFTGKTRAEQGTLLFQHKCPQNHVFWLTSEQMQN